jgi:hypothetical protein
MGIKYTGPWSYSKLRDFEDCKALFKRRHIEKLPEPESPALVHGNKVHDLIERWFQGWVKPAERREFERLVGPMLPDFKKLADLEPTLEQMWAHDTKWKPMENGFDKAAWVRAKTDAHLVQDELATVFDWKTGRPKEVYPDQLRFYGVLAMVRNANVKQVQLELWYVDHNKIVTGVVERAELPAIQKEFKRRATRIYNESKWTEEPGMHCRWCPFRKSVGGPCSF